MMDLRLRGGSGLSDTLKLGTVAQGHDTVSTSLTFLCARTHTHTHTRTRTFGGCKSGK